MRNKILEIAILGVLLALFNNVIPAAQQGDADTYVNDTAITTKVKSKILADDELSAFKINVKTENGIVKLTGEVNSGEGFYKAIEVAYSTPGVADVDVSDLKIIPKSQHPIDDSVITAKVKGMLWREKVFGDKPIKLFGIKVDTRNGVVYLSGKADNKEQIQNIETMVKKIKGVKDVVNEIA